MPVLHSVFPPSLSLSLSLSLIFSLLSLSSLIRFSLGSRSALVWFKWVPWVHKWAWYVTVCVVLLMSVNLVRPNNPWYDGATRPTVLMNVMWEVSTYDPRIGGRGDNKMNSGIARVRAMIEVFRSMYLSKERDSRSSDMRLVSLLLESECYGLV